MSTSRHPIAYRLEGLIGGQAKLLATVMALPLVDGIFAALVVAGALDSPLRIVETGLLIFGGSATAAVILAEMDGTPREHAKSVLAVGAIIVPVAAAEAAVAPVIANLVNLVIFERFAALVILAIAAKTASSQVGEWLPAPGAIIALGLVASVQPSNLSTVVAAGGTAVQPEPVKVASAAASAGVGVLFALGVAVGGPHLRGRVDLDRFRFGSSVALGMLAVSVLGFPGVPTDQPIALYVLLVTAVLSYDTDGSGVAPDTSDDDRPMPDEQVVETPRPQAGGAAADEGSTPSIESDAPGHGIDPVDTATATAGSGDDAERTVEAEADDVEEVVETEADDVEEVVETEADEVEEAIEAEADDEEEVVETGADDVERTVEAEADDVERTVEAEADDVEGSAEAESDEERQADEEYGQSRAPWL